MIGAALAPRPSIVAPANPESDPKNPLRVRLPIVFSPRNYILT
jgi:hypothetical protein